MPWVIPALTRLLEQKDPARAATKVAWRGEGVAHRQLLQRRQGPSGSIGCSRTRPPGTQETGFGGITGLCPTGQGWGLTER